MQLRVEGEKEHKGFCLKEPAILAGGIIVLTGRNGSGKSRLLESIQNNSSKSYLNNELVATKEITLVAHSNLTPNFGQNYNDAQFQNKITATLQLYDRIKADLVAPYDQNKAEVHIRNREGALSYPSLFNLCISISRRLGKSPSELSHDDIILNFEEPLQNVLGFQNMATIFNQYIKRLHINQYNEWRSREKGADIKYWTEEEFYAQFGERPWIIANRILTDAFDGKFLFSVPDENSQSYAYQAQLMQAEENISVSVDNLSSGEKTLLWLALTLFNSQYYEADSVQTPKILLIDEPDAYLHPKMVEKMYKTLESFKNNFNVIIIVSTHSPTTAALAPSENIYLVENNAVRCVDKDSAISELLDGVTQISLSPDNRRQVFVESQYDADVYQAIFSRIASNSKLLDPRISLYFVSSGPKMPEDQLKAKARQILNINDEQLLNEFVKGVNGVGSCSQVVGQVVALSKSDHETVRGIIDWDLRNNESDNICVLSKNTAYSIENITIDPICVLLLLHVDYPDEFTMNYICGSDVEWSDWLENDELLQKSIDIYIRNVLGRDNKKDAMLSYMSEKILLTDSGYLLMEGHSLERLVKEKYPRLNGYARKGKDGELKYSIVRRSMINLTNCAFLPASFEIVLASVQK